MNSRAALAVPALVVIGMIGLTGCSAYESLVHKQSTATFDDVEALEDGADLDAAWIPADASDITLRTSTVEKASDAVILLTSASELVGDCAETERLSAPAWVLDGVPDPYDAETVHVCGDWSVIPTDTGWYGWTPNSDEERTAASGR